MVEPTETEAQERHGRPLGREARPRGTWQSTSTVLAVAPLQPPYPRRCWRAMAQNPRPSTSRPCCKALWRWSSRDSRNNRHRHTRPRRHHRPLRHLRRRRRHGWWRRPAPFWPGSAATAPPARTTPPHAPAAAGSDGWWPRPPCIWRRRCGAGTPTQRGSFGGWWGSSKTPGQVTLAHPGTQMKKRGHRQRGPRRRWWWQRRRPRRPRQSPPERRAPIASDRRRPCSHEALLPHSE